MSKSDEFSKFTKLVVEIQRCENGTFLIQGYTYWDFESGGGAGASDSVHMIKWRRRESLRPQNAEKRLAHIHRTERTDEQPAAGRDVASGT